MQAGVEMNNTPAAVEATLNSMPGYVKAFELAFPGEAKAVNFDNMAKAIEAFETTLITPGAPFDAFLKGDARALTHGYFASGRKVSSSRLNALCA